MRDEQLGLAEVIAKVRDELSESLARGNQHPSIKFEYTAVEVDFEVAITNEGSAKGGVNVWVISTEGQAKHSNTQTHRIKVTMTPKGVGIDGALTTLTQDSAYAGALLKDSRSLTGPPERKKGP